MHDFTIQRAFKCVSCSFRKVATGRYLRLAWHQHWPRARWAGTQEFRERTEWNGKATTLQKQSPPRWLLLHPLPDGSSFNSIPVTRPTGLSGISRTCSPPRPTDRPQREREDPSKEPLGGPDKRQRLFLSNYGPPPIKPRDQFEDSPLFTLLVEK